MHLFRKHTAVTANGQNTLFIKIAEKHKEETWSVPSFSLSAILRSAEKAYTAERRPEASSRVVTIPFSRKIASILLAVGAGIPATSTKSLLLKTGRSKIQSSARIEYWE